MRKKQSLHRISDSKVKKVKYPNADVDKVIESKKDGMNATFYHSLLLLRLNSLRSFGLRYWRYDDVKWRWEDYSTDHNSPVRLHETEILSYRILQQVNSSLIFISKSLY